MTLLLFSLHSKRFCTKEEVDTMTEWFKTNDNNGEKLDKFTLSMIRVKHHNMFQSFKEFIKCCGDIFVNREEQMAANKLSEDSQGLIGAISFVDNTVLNQETGEVIKESTQTPIDNTTILTRHPGLTKVQELITSLGKSVKFREINPKVVEANVEGSGIFNVDEGSVYNRKPKFIIDLESICVPVERFDILEKYIMGTLLVEDGIAVENEIMNKRFRFIDEYIDISAIIEEDYPNYEALLDNFEKVIPIIEDKKNKGIVGQYRIEPTLFKSENQFRLYSSNLLNKDRVESIDFFDNQIIEGA